MYYGTLYEFKPKVWVLGKEALALIECDKIDREEVMGNEGENIQRRA